MDDHAWLAAQFETNRKHLRAVAYRMLGSLADADDAVQEAWLRLDRADTSAVDNLAGWLTTVVGRVCLDMLRARKTRREQSLDEPAIAAERTRSSARPAAGADSTATQHGHAVGPADEALLADSVGLALLVMLETLEPAERLAFVLHDTFGLSFDEIGAVVGRTPAAARQLASRARRRVQGAGRATAAPLVGQRRVIDAFLDALRSGDLAALMKVLDPNLVVTANFAAGETQEVRGAENWAKGALRFAQLLRDVRPMLVNGSVGLVFAPRGRLQRVLTFSFAGDTITRFDVIGDPERLPTFELAVLDG